VAYLLALLIRLYQLTLSRLLRAVFGPMCRFTPSCSQYALECIRSHGALRGTLLSVRRLSKCHPFHPGGYDPPPPRFPGSRREDMGREESKGAGAHPTHELPSP
jgi:uncharacterized protein